MPEGKIENARKEVIGIIIDLLIHDFDKSSIPDVLSFNKSDIAAIDEKYVMAEKICIKCKRLTFLWDLY